MLTSTLKRLSHLAIASCALAPLLLATPALACDSGEKLRLSQEISRLASKNAWAGVERSYEALLATKCELGFEQYWLGAESARYLGKTFEQWERLNEAKRIDPQQQVLESLIAIESNYGRIDLKGDPRRPPVLTRADMPFAPDQRKSIEWASEVVTNTGAFHGMLPLGEYDVSGVKFTAAVGEEFQAVTVGKQRAAPVAGTGDGGEVPKGESRGFIRYAGPIATIGPAFTLSGAPGEPVVDSSGAVMVQPGALAAGGISAELGGEIGLTYRAPEAGLALVLGYTGAFGGSNTMHQASGWLAGVLRPGQARIALGPSYTVLYGQGRGIYEAYGTGDQAGLPVEQIDYSGTAWAPGARASLGYGVLDLDKLRGIVELGGNWQTDGSRSYTGIGLRFGIVPAVPRFEE